MKTLFIDKLRVSHMVVGFICCVILYLMFRSRPLRPSKEWLPKASLIMNQDIQNTQNFLLSKKIPKIIHQTWRDFKVPEMSAPWVKKCHDLHADWEYWFWTDSAIRQLVADLYPQYLALFDSYPAGGYRSDAFRYFVMYEYGGVYIDTDMECIKPLDELIEKNECILSQEPEEHAHFLSPMGTTLVSNALIACRRNHAFFRTVIQDLPTYYGWFNWNDILRATGPYMLTEEYKYYIKDGLFQPSEAHTDPVYLADPETFQPSTDPSMRDHLREACIHSKGHSFLGDEEYVARQERLCASILKQGFHDDAPAQAYTNHHWTHTWAGERNDPYNIIGTNVYVDIRSLLDPDFDNKHTAKDTNERGSRILT